MKKYSKEEVLRQYEESGKIMYQATLDGDYKANNREGRRLLKIFKYFEINREFASDYIKDMLNSENVVVRTKAEAYCLALNENVDVAIEVLSEISSKKENEGLPKEYVEAVCSSIDDLMDKKSEYPQCDIKIEDAANCEVGSSPMIFSIITKLLLKLIDSNSIEEILSMDNEGFTEKYLKGTCYALG
ncbi:MAG: hypothetical protein IJZ00_10920 [Lachnospiraceae bacterium]|nr:hypothetical protein [Lachnospiraceae bacterium]